MLLQRQHFLLSYLQLFKDPECWSSRGSNPRPPTQQTGARTSNWANQGRSVQLNKFYYYPFKIFPQFWLAKSTLMIHHNQLLMTRFGRILCLARNKHDVQNAAFLQVNAPLTEKTWGRDWVVLVVKKMADISLVSRVRTTAGTRRNNG